MVSPKIEFEIVGTIAATSRLLAEARPPARRFGTYPVRAMAARTVSIVSGMTSSGRLSTRETVIGETPASLATSSKVTLPEERRDLPKALRLGGEDAERRTGEAWVKG